MPQPLRTALVGLGRAGHAHADCLVGLSDQFTLVAGCDSSSEARDHFQESFPQTTTYSDFGDLLETEKPEVVVLATTQAPRCALTLQAVDAGVRGIYAEKPMAVAWGDARRMVEACEARGVALVVNHQRRTLPVFRRARRLIDEGAIGEVKLIRASCAGDIMSDGTHLINTVNYLYGEAPARWVIGMLNLRPQDSLRKGETFTGRRYGHAVEYGGLALVEYEDRRRAEFHTGSLQIAGAAYQHYEIFGTKGRLLRPGDRADPPLLIQDDQAGGWRPVSPDNPGDFAPLKSLATPENYVSFARLVRGELTQHPLEGRSALRGHEILCAIYESARIRERVTLPLDQDAFALNEILAETDTAKPDS